MTRGRHVDGDRQPKHRTRLSHGDVAAQWQVLVAGGNNGLALSSAELYDPALALTLAGNPYSLWSHP